MSLLAAAPAVLAQQTGAEQGTGTQEASGNDSVTRYRLGKQAYDTQDFQTALEYLMPLAEEGHTLAQYYVAQIHHFGFGGVEKNDTVAVQWYRRAAQGGLVVAMFKLGNMYLDGDGVERDPTQAAAFYRAAGARGHAESLVMIARFYEEGLVYDKDEGEARVWYRRAIEHGSQEAMLRLASNLMSTERIPRDYRRAFTWIVVAAEQGNREAAHLRQSLRPRFYQEEIDRAEEWARNYLTRGEMPPRLEYDN